MEKTYKIMTFGCQMNANDSEKLSGLLKQMGYVPTEDTESADVVIINTCSVRENADVRVYGHLGAFKAIRRKKPDMVLAVCGCMMQQPEIVDAIRKRYKQVDLVFGTHNLHRFPQLLMNYLQSNERLIEVWDDNPEVIEGLPVDHKYDFKSYVTIMNGCNNFCTYCIVPYTRGREVSREPEAIIDEVTALAQKGCLEVTLLGQNVNSYGMNLKQTYRFADLLRDLNEVAGLRRIRFMTSHPKDISDEVIDAIARCDKVCPSIHLAIQSGSTAILKAMNRRYTKEYIMDLVDKIRAKIPDVVITTDIIVGFPGETESDFQDTLEVIEHCRFDAAFTFMYSKRSGTPAATMDNQIEDAIKHDRLNRLMATINAISWDINQAYRDRVVEVLVEEQSKNNPDRLTGRTFNGKLVNFTAGVQSIGEIIPVKILETNSFSLKGEAV